MLTFGSLFAGIGGLDLGLEQAGMRCLWQVEIDDYATRVLAKHWPDVRRWKDIKTFPPDADDTATARQQQHGWQADERPEAMRSGNGCDNRGPWAVDLVCGGFPCQDISYAGRGVGLAGERSGLFFEALRVVRQLRPRYVLLENVAALLSRGLDRVLGELAAIGYDAEWHCLPAAAVGAPHIRDRVFVVAYSECDRRNERRAQCKGQQRSAAPVIAGSRIPDTIRSRLERGPIIGSDARAKLAAVERSHRESGGQWFAEPDVGRVAHGVPARVDRLRGLGNAVVPQVAEFLGRIILEHHLPPASLDTPDHRLRCRPEKKGSTPLS